MRKVCFRCCEEKVVKLKNEERTEVYQNEKVTYLAEVYTCVDCDSVVPDNDLFARNFKAMNDAYQAFTV